MQNIGLRRVVGRPGRKRLAEDELIDSSRVLLPAVFTSPGVRGTREAALGSGHGPQYPLHRSHLALKELEKPFKITGFIHIRLAECS